MANPDLARSRWCVPPKRSGLSQPAVMAILETRAGKLGVELEITKIPLST